MSSLQPLSPKPPKIATMSKNTICLWFEGDAVGAAQFYAKIFVDSQRAEIHLAPGDSPSGKPGDVLTVEFTVVGIPCLGLNGGQSFKHCEAFRSRWRPTTRLRPTACGA
jgi:predicted 3-demethylubiquinone-9 3-methyltransferase (glyoxalase superfamily)